MYNKNESEVQDRWVIRPGALDSINLNDFEKMWAFSPKDATSIAERFRITDESDSFDGTPFPKNKYSKYNYSYKDEYHFLDTTPSDFIKEFGKNKKVIYRYNKEWFRCDNFTNNHDGLHIIFQGCSNTEGIGANIEDTWTHLLYSEISKTNKVSGYYNLARSGYGYHKIIQDFMVYVKKYGAPQYNFILMPNILRGFMHDKDTDCWGYTQVNPWADLNSIDSSLDLHRKEFPQWMLTWKLFLEYCSSIGTKVIWSTWDHWEVPNIMNIKIFNDTFFTIPKLNQELIATSYYDLIEREDAVVARDGHDGYIQQFHWYNTFLKTLKERTNIID